ncbi:MAG: hypothetical protein ISR65_19610 [Bacteriovoracaceae bacterium]|nr:hypothetical protein [Bacteriovoracaceae bacterium]
MIVIYSSLSINYAVTINCTQDLAPFAQLPIKFDSSVRANLSKLPTVTPSGYQTIVSTTKLKIIRAMKMAQGLGLHVRKKILEILLAFRKNSEDAHNSYATLLNEMYNRRLIDKAYIDKVINYDNKKKKSSYYLAWRDKQVIVRSVMEDVFEDARNIKNKILDKLHVPPKNRAIFTQMFNSIKLRRSEWKTVQRSIKLPDLSKKTIERFHAYLKFAELRSVDDRKRALEGLKHLYDQDVYYLPILSRFFSYLKFIGKTQNEQQRKSILAVIGDLFTASKETSVMRLFNKLEKERMEFAGKQMEIVKAYIIKDNPHLSAKRIDRLTQQEVAALTRKLERLQYSCRANNINAEQRRAMKDTAMLFTVTGVTLTGVNYTSQNYNKLEEEGAKLWGGKLAYDMVSAMILNYLFTSFIKPKGKYMDKFYGVYSFYAMVDIINSYIYGRLFGVNNKKVEAQFEELRTSPQFVRDFGDIMAKVQKHRQRLLPSIMGAYKEGLPRFVKDEKEVEWTEIKPSDLDQEKIRKKLLEVLAVKIYEDQDVAIRSGYFDIDRWEFHRMFDILFIKGIAVGLVIHRTLCMQAMNRTWNLVGESNRAWAFTMAFSIYVVNRVLTEQLYYSMRSKAIGL